MPSNILSRALAKGPPAIKCKSHSQTSNGRNYVGQAEEIK
jgi:hypothetical protein